MKHLFIALGLLSFFLLLPVSVSATTDVNINVRAEDGSSAGVSVKTSTKSSSRNEFVATQRVTVNGEEVSVSKRLEETREGSSDRQEVFRERLSGLEDQRKAQIVERIANSLDNVNKKLTSSMLAKVQRLENILDKINSRAEKIETHGGDVTAAYAAIEVASADIATAKEAIEAQAQSEYVIDITSEENIGENVKETTSELRTDLSAAADEVKKAGASVRNALQTLKEDASDE